MWSCVQAMFKSRDICQFIWSPVVMTFQRKSESEEGSPQKRPNIVWIRLWNINSSVNISASF